MEKQTIILQKPKKKVLILTKKKDIIRPPKSLRDMYV